jgi:hypothetical protein
MSAHGNETMTVGTDIEIEMLKSVRTFLLVLRLLLRVLLLPVQPLPTALQRC